MSGTVRMTRVDSAWLRMDSDVNLMMIVGVWLLQPGVRYQAVRERIEQRLLRYPHEGGSAIVVRTHHSTGDGVSLTSVVLSIADGGALPSQRSHDAAHVDDDLLTTTLIRPLTDLVLKSIDLPDEGVTSAMDLVTHPQAGTRELTRTGLRVANDLAALALMAHDSPTRLKGKPAGCKFVAWGEPLPLDIVKSVSKALNASINDVLLSCVAGAIGEDPQGKAIRAMVPVNLRPLDEAHKLGNRFGLVPLVLPIGISNPIERVHAVHARMGDLKGSCQPVLAFGVLALAGLLNQSGQDALLGPFAKKATAVMTNRPGPTRLLEFCGSTLRHSIFWVPQSTDVAVGASIFSYGGGVQFAQITGRKLCPEPQKVVERFAPELHKLLWLMLMLPRGA